MKRIYSFLFAILTLAATTGVFTSCQEDAPEIDYTINITVNNDFTEVVDAINNGTLKQEAAIAALTAAIEKMNGEQNEKMDAIVKAINDLAKTTDAKLAIIEAAMKAQTLALEAKLDLLTAAVKAQTLKQEEMGKLLATAIDNLSGTLEEKLAAIEAIIESTSATLAEKIAAVEAAMKAQTLSLENKLALLETAIKNIPDYSEKMDAIEAAIKNAPDYTTALEEIKEAIADAEDSFTTQLGLLKTAIEELPDYGDQLTAIKDAIPTIPNYEDQFAAIELALKAIADKIEAQQNQYADELEDLTDAIDAITAAVAAGNKSQKDALAEIITLLENGALAGGGSGSGSGDEGGEGEGGEGEDTTPYIAIEPLADVGDTFFVTYLIDQELPIVEGLEFQKEEKFDEVKNVTYKITVEEGYVKLKGNITWIRINAGWVRDVDCTHMSCLEYFGKLGGKLSFLDVSKNKNLKEIDIYNVGTSRLKLCPDVPGGYKKISFAENYFDKAAQWDEFFETLPTASESEPGKLFIWNYGNPSKENEEFHIKPTDAQIKKAIDKNYKVYKDRNFAEEYVVE